MRFLVYWALRREELCDIKLCPDSSDNGNRCEKCPLDRLDGAQHSEAGQPLRRPRLLCTALQFGAAVSLDDIAHGECFSMVIIQ